MIRNVHERIIHAPLAVVGGLVDRLASRDDALWPHDRWPPIKFDGPLKVGASGGHGPVRYTVESYEPHRFIRFRFTSPRGFRGTHGFDVEEIAPGEVRLRHMLEMRATGLARLTWPLMFRWLHDALIEDALDSAEAHSTYKRTKRREWRRRVKFLRRLTDPALRRSGRKYNRQITTGPAREDKRRKRH